MAGAVEKTKRRKKKAPRTEVIVSDSESDHIPPSPAHPTQSSTTSPPSKRRKTTSPSPSPPPENPILSSVTLQTANATKEIDINQTFSAYYMDHVVREFADDLDRIRAADDFGEGSLAILIQALQSGVEAFGEGERRRVGLAGSGE